jgi:purine-binding chemotaxis protein CheW
MIAVSKGNIPFVLFEAGNGLFAMSAKFVGEMLLLPPVVRVPNMPPEIRGMINLRGSILKLIDLRIVLGVTSARMCSFNCCTTGSRTTAIG